MIELKNIEKIYKIKNQKDVCALNKLNYKFPDNGFFQIKGYSGSGKTTLLGIIGGLLCPTSGEIRFNGANLNKLSEKEIDQYRATNIAYIFQQYCLLEELDVIENIKLSCSLKDADEKARECLRLVGLAGYEHRKINELSGGQKQRVSIARALAKDAKIILADEPTASLDKDNSISLFSLLKEISSERLIICASHESELLKQFNPVVLELNNGILVNKQPPVLNKASKLNNVEKPLLKKRLISFGNKLFKKYFIRSTVMSLLLATTSALAVFSFSLSQFDKDNTTRSIMLNTGENSITLDRMICDYNHATFSQNEISYLRNLDNFIVLPVVNPNINPNSYLVSFDVNTPSQVKASDNRYLYSPGFCEYSDEVQNNFPLISGRLPGAENEILITNFTYNLYENYGFGSFVRKEEIQSMEHFLSLDLTLPIQGKNYKIVGIVDCGNEKENAEEIDFTSRFANDSSESNYYYSYAMSSPRNLIFISPNEKYNNVTTVATNLFTSISVPTNESKISVSYLSKNVNNNIKINENNHYGISAFALSKIVPFDIKLEGSKDFVDYSKVFDWENKFSSLSKYSSDISLSKLFSKFNNGTTSYLSVLACGDFVSKNGLPVGSELGNLKTIATNFFKAIGKEYDFSMLDDDKTEILKSFYVALLSSTMLDPNTTHSINGFYNSKGKQITINFLESIKDLLNVALEDLSFNLKTTYNADNFDIKDIKIGYLNIEEEVMNNYLPANDSYTLYTDSIEFSDYVNEYGLSTHYKSVILSNLDNINLINCAFSSSDFINTNRMTTAIRNGAIEYVSPMKDYLETTSYFALIFAAILCLISIVLTLLFMLSIGKAEEKNLTLLRTFGYSKYKSVIPLVTIPLISAIIATTLSTIFAIIVNIFGNSYLSSFFGISASFIITNPLFLLLSILTPFVLAVLSLIIPINKLKKGDMLSILN